MCVGVGVRVSVGVRVGAGAGVGAGADVHTTARNVFQFSIISENFLTNSHFLCF